MKALVKAGNKALATSSVAQAMAEQKQYLTFMLGGETFAVSILGIKEIIPYAGLTEVPMMPKCICGVINLRGAVVPVMDLSVRFGKPARAVTKRTCIVIVELDGGTEEGRQDMDMGVVVDAVNAVLEIPSSEIEPAPAFGARIHTDFIEGMGKVNGKFVILLNVNRVLSIDEIGALAQADDATPLLPA
ncbi:MAG: purine-binding chemotaxis protein CheW [Glaciimonas sp.]|nr:purine-binding chemotaxis protein CheW [Glaciimonas sp.]